MNIEDIREILPHSYPFLLVDRVLKIETKKGGEEILAQKNITINEPFFTGHFPKRAVFPGVMQVEALAQAAGILCFKLQEVEEKKRLGFLAKICSFKFRDVVTPGDVFLLKAKLLFRKKDLFKLLVCGLVAEKEVCTGEIFISLNNS